MDSIETNIDNKLSVSNQYIINKGFLIIDSIFKENNWQLINNKMDHITYSKFGDETSRFDIKILRDKITVSVPIKNSIYQYVTSFKTYFEASEYVEQRFNDFIN
jgi:hypothetical protein